MSQISPSTVFVNGRAVPPNIDGLSANTPISIGSKTDFKAGKNTPRNGSPPERIAKSICPSKMPLQKLLGREIVHIKVGMDLQDFGVHKVLICTMSPFFKAAFNSGFEEAKTGIMKLEHTDSKVFEVFYTWLYTKTLCCDDVEMPWVQKYNILLQLYIFGDMAQVPALKNALIRAIYVILQKVDDSGVNYSSFRGNLKYVWENTTAQSPLRRFVVDICVWELSSNFLVERTADDFTIRMCLDIMRAMEVKWIKSHSSSGNPLYKLENYDEPVPRYEAPKKKMTFDPELF